VNLQEALTVLRLEVQLPKLTTSLVGRFKVIGIEDLSVHGMMVYGKLAR
jgi:hypothetical protein